MTAGRGLAITVLLAGATLAACGRGPQPDELTALPSTLLPTVSAAPTPTPSPTATATTRTTTTTAPTATSPATRARPAPSRSVARPQPAGRSWSAAITFYGAGDNDPAGSTAIAHPNTRHAEAGGTGTYADPVTLASDPRELPVGTVVYYPPLKKYFVMEDDCASCIEEWESDQRPHIDLWAGDHSGADFLACENALTPGGTVTVELSPPPGRPVDTRSLYGSGGCLV